MTSRSVEGQLKVISKQCNVKKKDEKMGIPDFLKLA